MVDSLRREAGEPESGTVLDADISRTDLKLELVAVANDALMPLDCYHVLAMVISVAMNCPPLSLANIGHLTWLATPFFHRDSFPEPDLETTVARTEPMLKETPVPSVQSLRVAISCAAARDAATPLPVSRAQFSRRH